MRPMLFLVAAMAYSQTAADPADVLSHARAKVRDTMQHIPKYACIQTVERTYYATSKSHPAGASCDQLSADRKNAGKAPRIDGTDRLRLDVAEGMEQEIHSWPGASRFDLVEIDQIVDKGPFGTGAFGGYLLDIFDNDGTHYDYQGEKAGTGHRVLIYGYNVAQSVSHYQVRDGPAWFTAAYSGSFEVDTESFEIVRLTIKTTELPVETRLCQADTMLDYQRVAIGDGSFLLPRESQLRLTFRNGEETNNTTNFTGCREFHAESAVSFSAPSVKLEVPDVPGKSRQPLPRGLDVELRLETPIDTDTAAAGDPVSATVVHAVHAFQSKEILIPAGAVAHGRVSRLEHHFVPSEYLVIGISFESLEMDGESSPFAARLNRSSSSSVARGAGGLPAPLHPRSPVSPTNSFEFPFAKRHVITAGTVSQWVTVSPATSH
jgi:hypothetical protein